MKHNVLQQQIEKADNAKKTNVLDLSSDQDLTIGLMNLLFIEDYISNPESNLSQMIAGVREKLMNRIVKKSDKNKSRPLFSKYSYNELEQIYAERDEIYSRHANYVINGDDNIDTIVNTIVTKVTRYNRPERR